MASIGVLAVVAAPTARADLVIYRCTDASGAVTVQNDQRCPAGSRQERRVIDDAPVSPPPPPPPAPAIEPVAPVPAVAIVEAAPEPPPVELLPPPPLFQCRTWNDEPYLTERDTPARRCAPLRTVGLAGGAGAGAACEEREDRCEPVADDALCERWRERLQNAQGAERFGVPAREGESARDVGRVEQLLAASTCAASG
ncbi:MAG: hypothetical protein A2190_12310 [Lysobacterales bacterium RIFOXYA1_FULL_69_10]|nr:MAG: hypothetical protein A2190_12310 [Xanthomonadales bacterium RIFOXYA1_FULL_69_10]